MNPNVQFFQVHFPTGSAGVASVLVVPATPGRPGSPGFITEANADILKLAGIAFSGNMTNSHQVPFTTPPLNLWNWPMPQIDPYHSYFTSEWSTDYQNNYEGWAIDGFNVQCGGYQVQAGQLPYPALALNRQNDGVLLGTSDVTYFRVTQPPGVRLLVHLRPDDHNRHPHANYDLYVAYSSREPMPGPYRSWDWSSTRDYDVSGNMLEDVVSVPNLNDGMSHEISIGVFANQEDQNYPGGYRLYANAVTREYNVSVSVESV